MQEEQPQPGPVEIITASGLPVTMDLAVMEDRCNRCGGSGTERYSTVDDIFTHKNRRPPHVHDCPDCTCLERWEYEEPNRSATRPCTRCGGTGKFPGDITFRYSLGMTYDLNLFPDEPDDVPAP